MKLITKKIAQRMPGPRQQDEKGEDAIVHLKLFDPYGSGTWLITEAWQVVILPDGSYKEEPLSYVPETSESVEDIFLYGYCCLFEWEWGLVSLKELSSLTKFGKPRIEREKHQSDGKHTVKQLTS